MNFFEYQDRARRSSALYLSLFALAVFLLIGLTTLLFALMAFQGSGQPLSEFELLQVAQIVGWQNIGWIALTVCGVVAIASLFKLRELSGGGRTVAEAMGGRLINLDSQDQAERRALNVVEEMAIASGTPVPDVYVIEDQAINAFAAGYKEADAVVGLTRGCIEKLDRAELQGVVAHEFSHIFNGDMRLNIRLIGMLHGILFIGLVGSWLLRSATYRSPYSYRSSSRRGNGVLALFGIGAALMAIGYIGTFFGNMIKAAVSRQREYLADASAVQFTRDSSGIAGALKKIGGNSFGSQMSAGRTSEFSHMFFANGLKQRFSSFFSTHPALADRIQRIEPSWDGQYPAVAALAPDTATVNEKSVPTAAQAAAAQQISGINTSNNNSYSTAAVAQSINSIGHPGEAHMASSFQMLANLDDRVRAAAHEPFAARALIYLLVMPIEGTERDSARTLLEEIAHPGVRREMGKIEDAVRALPAAQRLAALDLSVPAIKRLAPFQYEVFKRNLLRLLELDGTLHLREWALYRVLMHAMEGSNGGRAVTVSKGQVPAAASTLLAAMAHCVDAEYLDANSAYIAGLEALALPVRPLPLQKDITIELLDNAVAVCSRLKPLHKPRLLKALVKVIEHDGQVDAPEAEMLRAIADTLDCPMPPIVG